MADGVKVTDYPALPSFANTDIVEVVRPGTPGVNYKATYLQFKNDLKAFINPDASGAVVTFADADIVNVYQSGVKKTATIAQLKSLFGGASYYTPNTVSMILFRDIIAAQSLTTAANAARAYKFRVLSSVKITLRANVTGAVASSNIAAGIYSISTSNLPDVFLYDFGQISTATTGNKTGNTVTVAPGEYYLVWSTSHGIDFTHFQLESAYPDATFSGINGRLEASKTYAFPIPAMSTFTWTQTATQPNVPFAFRVETP